MADQQSIAQQWDSFDDQKRIRLLGRMSPEQKKSLRSQLESTHLSPTALEKKAMDPNASYTPTTQSQSQGEPTAAGKFMEKTAPTVAAAAPAVLGTLGGIGGTAVGGIPGGFAGAAAGGAAGEAYRQKMSGEPTSVGGMAKEGAVQAAWEFPGPLVKAGGKALKAAGISEKAMNFALRTGEDVKTGVNPGKALVDAKLKALTASTLYKKASAYADTVQASMDSLIRGSEANGARLVNPLASMNAIFDKYIETARRGLRPDSEKSIQALKDYATNVYSKMVHGEQLSGYGVRQVSEQVPISKAVQFKRAIGQFADWEGRAIDSTEKEAYATAQGLRREIYGALNKQIKDAIPSGAVANQVHDMGQQLQSLYEAKSALGQAVKHSTETAHSFYQALAGAARNVGTASAISDAVDAAQKALPAAAKGISGVLRTVAAISGTP